MCVCLCVCVCLPHIPNLHIIRNRTCLQVACIAIAGYDLGKIPVTNTNTNTSSSSRDPAVSDEKSSGGEITSTNSIPHLTRPVARFSDISTITGGSASPSLQTAVAGSREGQMQFDLHPRYCLEDSLAGKSTDIIDSSCVCVSIVNSRKYHY
jgi:hypothetical protein